MDDPIHRVIALQINGLRYDTVWYGAGRKERERLQVRCRGPDFHNGRFLEVSVPWSTEHENPWGTCNFLHEEWATMTCNIWWIRSIQWNPLSQEFIAYGRVWRPMIDHPVDFEPKIHGKWFSNPNKIRIIGINPIPCFQLFSLRACLDEKKMTRAFTI